MTKVLIKALWCLKRGANGWRKDDVTISVEPGALAFDAWAGTPALAGHPRWFGRSACFSERPQGTCSGLYYLKNKANNWFNESNEARTDIATSVIFGLLAVSNQHPLEC